MSNNNDANNFTNREFVSMVRAELAAAGRPDVTIERSWIDEDEPGYPFLLHVPIGTELSVPLKAPDGFLETLTDTRRKRYALEFSQALINLRSAEAMLLKYAGDVRKAVNAAVAAARADGLDILLDRVGFAPTYIGPLTYKDWKHAALHVLANVTFRHTSFYLKPTISGVIIEEPADVATEMAGILEEQRERQDRLAELDRLGCDLFVDGLTLDLLAAYGLDAAETLATLWKKQHLNLRFRDAGQDVALSLITSGGYVTASIQLPQAFWNGEHLWFTGSESENDHKPLIGKSLGSLVPHPAFTERPIADVFHQRTDHIVFDLSGKLSFDAETGRLWREEQLAA